MIIYQADKREFLQHALRDDIEEVVSRSFRGATGRGVGPSEIQSWKHSLLEMAKVLQDEEIPETAGVAIEYQLPQSSKRIDFVITGEDETAQSKVVIVELKQWSESRRSEKDAIIWARRGGRTGEREGPHPSYQAWSYAAYLQDFNAAVQDSAMTLHPCAYLHNHPRNGEIDHVHYREHLDRAPLFLARERKKLQAFIREHVRYGDSKGALYSIENGRIRPSKMLADCVAGLLQGKPEFVLLDDQKLVHETVLQAEARAVERKQVVIVRGGPGTGKSVVAINLLGTLVGRNRNARYVSKNAAPRAVYEARLTGTFKRTRISNLFSGSGSFVNDEADTYDALIVDEAHRLNEKSGLYRNLGENQVKELIRTARCTVFFVDDNQRVTLLDIGHTEELRRQAEIFGAEITELELSSQFRCNGSDGYLAWIDDTLGIRETANDILDTGEYDFRVLDNPAELHALVELKNRANNRSRVVAGYCWKWPSKRDPEAWDIELPEFDYRRRWNLDKDGSLWIVTPGSVEQVGCIHTCQGLELDYVGVIIGPDLAYRDGRIVTDATKRASSDQSVKGLGKMMQTNREAASALADSIIKNTYRTLMTRGMKGCYVYCVDAALGQYLASRLSTSPRPTFSANIAPSQSAEKNALPDAYPLPRISSEERESGAATVPLIEFDRIAAFFGKEGRQEEEAQGWVAVPRWIRPAPGMFVTRVPQPLPHVGIPAGSWCLFEMKHVAAGRTETGAKYGTASEARNLNGSAAPDLRTGERLPREYGSLGERWYADGGSGEDRGSGGPLIRLEDERNGSLLVAEFLTVLAV